MKPHLILTTVWNISTFQGPQATCCTYGNVRHSFINEYIKSFKFNFNAASPFQEFQFLFFTQNSVFTLRTAKFYDSILLYFFNNQISFWFNFSGKLFLNGKIYHNFVNIIPEQLLLTIHLRLCRISMEATSQFPWLFSFTDDISHCCLYFCLFLSSMLRKAKSRSGKQHEPLFSPN